jgi:hypothetical protein
VASACPVESIIARERPALSLPTQATSGGGSAYNFTIDYSQVTGGSRPLRVTRFSIMSSRRTA